MPRLYRESAAQLDLGGLGQRHRLDVLRALAETPESRGGVLRRARAWRAAPTARLDAASRGLAPGARRPRRHRAARAGSSSGLALALQASLLVRHAPAAVADAFCATRLGGDCGRAFGTLPPASDAAAIIERHRPLLG